MEAYGDKTRLGIDKAVAGHNRPSVSHPPTALYRDFRACASYKGRCFLDRDGTVWECVELAPQQEFPDRRFFWLNLEYGEISALLILRLRPVNLVLVVEKILGDF